MVLDRFSSFLDCTEISNPIHKVTDRYIHILALFSEDKVQLGLSVLGVDKRVVLDHFF